MGNTGSNPVPRFKIMVDSSSGRTGVSQTSDGGSIPPLTTLKFMICSATLVRSPLKLTVENGDRHLDKSMTCTLMVRDSAVNGTYAKYK